MVELHLQLQQEVYGSGAIRHSQRNKYVMRASSPTSATDSANWPQVDVLESSILKVQHPGPKQKQQNSLYGNVGAAVLLTYTSTLTPQA